ncbi:MAG: hypothetical protein RL367_147, partial [Pseudomonadota bacterium]
MTRRLSPGLSTILDALRAGAALYVVLHHIFDARGYTHGAGLLFIFGQEAVLIFFLLSGFVIQSNEADRVASDRRGYALRRFIRIYPLLIMAILVSTLVAFAQERLASSFSWSSLFGTLLALQDDVVRKPGAIIRPYMINAPLWSLSYEIWFYVLFPFVSMVFRRLGQQTCQLIVGGTGLVAVLLYLGVPNFPCLVFAYFLIWWLGAMLAEAHATGVPAIRTTLILQIALTSAAIIAICYAEMARPDPRMVGFLWLMARDFLAALVLYQALAWLVGRRWHHGTAQAAAFFSYLASLSYGLYVLHYPLLIDSGFFSSAAGLIGGGLLLVALCWLFDRKLSLWLRRTLRMGRPP